MSESVSVSQPVRLVELPELYLLLSESERAPYLSHQYLTLPALVDSAVGLSRQEVLALCAPWPSDEIIPEWVASAIHRVALSVSADNPVSRLCVWSALLSRLVDRPLRSQSHHLLVTLTVRAPRTGSRTVEARAGLVWSALRELDPAVSALVVSLADGLPSLPGLNGRVPHLYRSRVSEADGVSYLQLPSSAPRAGLVSVPASAGDGSTLDAWLLKTARQSESESAPVAPQSPPAVSRVLSPILLMGQSSQIAPASSERVRNKVYPVESLSPESVSQLLREGVYETSLHGCAIVHRPERVCPCVSARARGVCPGLNKRPV